MKIKLQLRDVITIVAILLILCVATYKKYVYEHPQLPVCVDVYNTSEVCDRG